MDTRVAIVGTIVILAAIFFVAPSTGTNSWSISASNSIDVPSETFTVEGETFRVSSVSLVDSGSITVSVSPGNDERYQINLYDNNKNIQAFKTVEGSTTVSFSTAGLDPGTYVVAPVQDGAKDVQPVVVSEMSIDVTAPTEIESDEPFQVRATLNGNTGGLSTVEAVVWGNGERYRTTLDQTGPNSYAGSITDLSVGQYTLHVGARGSEQIEGRNEFIGIADGKTITVTQPTTTTTTTPTPDPTPEPTPDPTATPTPEPTPDPTPEPTPDPTPEPTPDPTPDPTTTPTPEPTPVTTVTPTPGTTVTSDPPTTGHRTTSGGSTTPATTDPASTSSTRSISSTDDGPIQPQNSTERPQSSGSGPGFGILAGIVAVVIVAYRRHG